MGFDLYRHRAAPACAAQPRAPVRLAQDANVRQFTPCDRRHSRAESVRATLMMIDSQQKISVKAAVFTFAAATARLCRNSSGLEGFGCLEDVVVYMLLFTAFQFQSTEFEVHSVQCTLMKGWKVVFLLFFKSIFTSLNVAIQVKPSQFNPASLMQPHIISTLFRSRQAATVSPPNLKTTIHFLYCHSSKLAAAYTLQYLHLYCGCGQIEINSSQMT